eukprot:5113885-Pleurochrysis_carterae.AAC.1
MVDGGRLAGRAGFDGRGGRDGRCDGRKYPSEQEVQVRRVSCGVCGGPVRAIFVPPRNRCVGAVLAVEVAQRQQGRRDARRGQQGC